MKQQLLPAALIFLLFAFTACEDDDAATPTGILGTWELAEQLADPGDGSGTFEVVDSDREITFISDSTYTANGVICEFTTESGTSTPTTGTYSLSSGEMKPGDCRNVPPQATVLTLEFVGDELILNYPCIEPCRHKYTRK